MATINPFYRFEDAIQVGSMGERGRILSLATDDIYGQVNVSFVGQTINQLLNFCANLIQQYNYDLQANFKLDRFYAGSTTQPYPVQIFIYDENLVALFPLHKISITLIVDTAGVIVNSAAWSMGVVSASYNYSDPLVQEEVDACKALVNYALTGSAIFPKSYTYDPLTGIATSTLARAKPCKFDAEKGIAVRFPADVYPRGAKPQLQFPFLSPDGKYISSIIAQIIAFAKNANSISEISDYIATIQPPINYLLITNVDLGTPPRIEVTILNVNGDAFNLVLRNDNGFSAQRFYAPTYSTYSFIQNYADNIDLPYQPDEYYKYGGVYYDLDFCEFLNCASPAPESYQMPAKTGDEFRFNVLPYQSNVLPYDSMDIGIFDSNFNLVQKIGNANKVYQQITIESNAWFKPNGDQLSYFYWNDYIDDETNYFNSPFSFYFTNCDGDVIGEPLATIAPNTWPSIIFPNNPNNINPFIESLSWPDNIEVMCETLPITGLTLITFVVKNIAFDECICGISGRFDNIAEQWYSVQPTEESKIIPIQQQLAQTIIPSLPNGCYRFGLMKYNLFVRQLFQEYTSGSFPFPSSPFNYIAIYNSITSTLKYLISVPDGITTFDEFMAYVATIFPNRTFKSQNSSVPNILKLDAYNNSIDQDDLLVLGNYDFQTQIFTITAQASTNDQIGEDAPNSIEIYSFSNPIEINNYECFTTIVQFWNNSQSIGEGFEYFGDWHQQVRLGINGGGQKPVIAESTYRQSNGVTRRPQNKQDLSIDLHTDFLDFETQSALVDATRHTNFVVDGRNLFVNGDIEVATIQDFTTESSFEDLAQVKFSALIQGYQPKNSTCVNC